MKVGKIIKLGIFFAIFGLFWFLPSQGQAQTVTTLPVIQARDPAYTVGGTFTKIPSGYTPPSAFVRYGKKDTNADTWPKASPLSAITYDADQKGRFEVILGGLESGAIYNYQAGITYKSSQGLETTGYGEVLELAPGVCEIRSAKFSPSGFPASFDVVEPPEPVTLEVEVTDNCRDKVLQIQIVGQYIDDSIDIIENALFSPTGRKITLTFDKPGDQEGEGGVDFYWINVEGLGVSPYNTKDLVVNALREKYKELTGEDARTDLEDALDAQSGLLFKEMISIKINEKIDPRIKDSFLSYRCPSLLGFGSGRCLFDWEGLRVDGAFAKNIDDDDPPDSEACDLKIGHLEPDDDKTKEKNPATDKPPCFQDDQRPRIKAILSLEEKCINKTVPFFIGLKANKAKKVAKDFSEAVTEVGKYISPLLFLFEETETEKNITEWLFSWFVGGEYFFPVIALDLAVTEKTVEIDLDPGEILCDKITTEANGTNCAYRAGIINSKKEEKLVSTGDPLTYDCHKHEAAGETDENKCDEPWGFVGVKGAKIFTDIGLQNVSGVPATGVYTGVYTFLEPLPGLGGSIDTRTGVGDYVNKIITLVVMIAGVLAVLMIVIGGIKWMLEESVFEKGAAKKMIQNALFGLVLVLASYMILNTINPNLVDVSLVIKSQSIDIESATQKPDGTFDYSKCKPPPKIDTDCDTCTEPGSFQFTGNNKSINADFVLALLEMKKVTDKENIKWQITEAWPASYKGHCSQGHYNGHAIDFNFTTPSSDDKTLAQNINVVIEAAKKQDIKIQYEIKEKNKFDSLKKGGAVGITLSNYATGDHFHASK